MAKINCNKLKKKESIELKEEFYNFVEQCFNEEISAENLILTEDLANKFVKKQTDKIYYTITFNNKSHSNSYLFGILGSAIGSAIAAGNIFDAKIGSLKKIMDKAKTDPELQKYIKKIETYNGKELTPEVKKEIKAQVKMALKYLKQIKYYKPWLKAKKKEEKRDAKYG